MKKFNLFVPLLHVGLLLFSLMLFLLVKDMPLLGTFGFESANYFAVLLGPFILWVASLNTSEKKKSFNQIFGRELMWLFFHLTAISALLFVNGFSRQSCSTGAGILPFIVVLFPPLLLNLSIGSILALLLESRILKTLIVFLGYLLYYGFIVFCWWSHGTFRVLTHASILMSSDLLEGDSLSIGVLGFRFATLLLALAFIFVGIYFLNSPAKKMFAKGKRPILAVLAVALIALHAGLSYLSEKSIGKDRSELIADYSSVVQKDDIKVFYNPLKTSLQHAQDIALEALYYKEKLIKKMGEVKVPITIWLHETELDKFLYTGAKNVHFALPRHQEIHISGHNSPHGVLGHELAHIYLGAFSSSLLGYPSANGLIPNLALTEGLATALTSELNQNDLTLLEQAQGLYQAEVEVDFEKLFSANPLHFAMLNPRVAYIYAGAAVEFLLASSTNPQEKIKTLAQMGTLESISPNEDIKTILSGLVKKLKEPVTPYAISFAEKNFKSSGIIISDCSNKMASQKNRLIQALINQKTDEALSIIELLPENYRLGLLEDAIEQTIKDHRFKDALSLIRKALALSPNNFKKASLKLKELQCLATLEDYFSALTTLREMDKKLFAPGTERYLIAMEILLSSMLLDEEQALSKAIIDYFMADGAPLELVYLSFELEPTKTPTVTSTIAQYLLARFEMNENRFAEALISINFVLEKNLLPKELEKECYLMRIRALIELKEEEKAHKAYLLLGGSQYSKAEMGSLLERINRLTFNRTHS